LLAARQDERRPLLDDIRRIVRGAVDMLPETIQSLRRDHGISLPALSPQWDVVPTALPNPSETIAAFDGNQSEIRITLHLDSLVDNTTTVELEGLGISHLIGISTGGLKDSWNTSEDGGMIVVVNCRVAVLSVLLHDILLDMAMIHAKSQPWSGIREQLNSHTIATLKAQFVQEIKLSGSFSYDLVGECRYFPLAAFARKKSVPANSTDHFDGLSYVSLWTQFASFAAKRSDVTLQVGRDNLAGQILQRHINSGQISPTKLTSRIAHLSPGHYCLYFLTRKAHQKAKAAQLSSFFQIPKAHFRTQRWIIHPRDKYAKEAAVFLSEQYISLFPFYIWEQ
jgi:hypothetical protein